MATEIVNLLSPDDVREMTCLGFECESKLLALLTLMDEMVDTWSRNGSVSKQCAIDVNTKLGGLWFAWRESIGVSSVPRISAKKVTAVYSLLLSSAFLATPADRQVQRQLRGA